MAFDMSQVQRGARNRRTPYHEAAQKYDPKGYTVYNHMYYRSGSTPSNPSSRPSSTA